MVGILSILSTETVRVRRFWITLQTSHNSSNSARIYSGTMDVLSYTRGILGNAVTRREVYMDRDAVY